MKVMSKIISTRAGAAHALLAAGLLSGGAGFAQTCATDQSWVASAAKCATVINKIRTNKPSATCAGQGVCEKTGGFVRSVALGAGVGGRPLGMMYDSTRPSVAAAQGVSLNNFGESPSFGPMWTSNYHRTLVVKAGGQDVTAYRGSGVEMSFQLVNGVYVSDPDVNDNLEVVTGGYLYTNMASMVLESYNTAGRLLSLKDATGGTVTFNYSTAAGATAPAAGYLLSVVDNNGRTTSFSYTLPAGGNALYDGKITSITATNGLVTTISYNAAGNPERVVFPDGTANRFLYENAGKAWQLTGIVDASGLIRSTAAYGDNGTVVATEGASGANPKAYSYVSAPAAISEQFYDGAANVLYKYTQWSQVEGAQQSSVSGAVTGRTYMDISGVPFVTSSTIPSGVSGSSATTYYQRDMAGNVLVSDDPQGLRTCSVYDAKNRQTLQVTGLPYTVDCSTVTPEGAVLPAGAQRVATSWHPDWRLPLTVKTFGSLSTFVYHGQIDPFTNAVANCSTAPLLVNGKPSPYLCKTVLQAVLPTGLIDAAVPSRVSSSTYDAMGRTLTTTDAKGGVSTLTYYADTTFASAAWDAVGHTIGDLATVKNQLNQTTTIATYDRAGRVRRVVSANGVASESTYSMSGNVLTSTQIVTGQPNRVTTNTYDINGVRTASTAPNGVVSTAYLDLVNNEFGVKDALGDKTRNVRDASGNVIQSTVADPAGKLASINQSSFDLLKRVQQKKVVAVATGATPVVVSSANPANVGAAVSFTYKTNDPAATGNVAFFDGDTVVGVAAISAGSASISTTTLPSGSRSIVAAQYNASNTLVGTSEVLVQNIRDPSKTQGVRCGDFLCAAP